MPVQRCQEDNKPGWRWGSSGKCYTYTAGDEASEAAAKKKAEKQGAAAHAAGYKGSLVLQLKTAPATLLCATPQMPGYSTYRKELIKIGHYDDESGEDFNVTSETLDNWIETFTEMRHNGNKVPLSLSHAKADDPGANAGWCLNMFRDNGTLVGSLVLSDEKRELALNKDVSIYSPPEHIDPNGVKYMQPITHIALTANPAVTGLGAFVRLSLSLDKGDTIMDKKILAKLLGIAEDASDELITSTINGLKAPAKTIALSEGVKAVDPMLMQVVSENRTGKLDTLLNAEIITPALKDKIAKVFVESAALTLSLSKGGDKAYFDLLMEVLTESAAAKKLLGEKTVGQSTLLALSSKRTQQPNEMQQAVKAHNDKFDARQAVVSGMVRMS